MAKTYAQSNANLDFDFGRTTYNPTTTYYLGLSTTPIDKNGTGATEPSSSTGYKRVAITNSKSSFSQANNGELQNTITIEFPESTATWGTITHYFLADSLTGGQIRFYEAFTTPRQVAESSTVMFRPQTLTFTDR